LQLDDRPPDAKPNQLRVAVAVFEHLISASRCHYLSIAAMFADQQIGGTSETTPPAFPSIWHHPVKVRTEDLRQRFMRANLATESPSFTTCGTSKS